MTILHRQATAEQMLPYHHQVLLAGGTAHRCTATIQVLTEREEEIWAEGASAWTWDARGRPQF
jgi:hypothetical protein